MQLFYNPDLTQDYPDFSFSREESKHIVRVLRKMEGDILHITNGKGWLFTAEIVSANPNNCKVRVVDKELQSTRPYKIHMAVAPTKMNDRYEWFLEKATEIGVDSITPIICENSERRTIKKERYNKIIQSAMKQSLQCYLPNLNEACSFIDFIKKNHDGQKFVAHCEDTDRKSFKNELKTNQDITILIGPEGDFSVKEITTAIDKTYIPVTLGKTRLRTETAAIAACHTISLVNE